MTDTLSFKSALAEHAFIHFGDGVNREPAFSLNLRTGDVVFREDVTPNEAAVLFWRNVKLMYPGLKEELA